MAKKLCSCFYDTSKRPSIKTAPYSVGERFPSDSVFLNSWLRNLIEEVEGREQVDGINDAEENEEGSDIRGLHPPVRDLKELIENNSEVNIFFHQMFSQVPRYPPYNRDPAGKPEVRNYHLMLRLINSTMTRAPEFNPHGILTRPINVILAWPMGTVGGYAAFLNDEVNVHFKNILNCWGEFLKSEASAYVLSTNPTKGWFGENAMKAMPDFVQTFKCDPDKPHYGFTSWDNFFTREFRDDARPIAYPDDNKVIANACESAPYRLQKNVKSRDRFWIKSQQYSVIFMMANDILAEKFVGGTVYQAVLSFVSYHRWHSPVNGKIVTAYVKDGSYYSEIQSEGFDVNGPDLSMAFVTEVATRALIFIEADNPYIGLMCFIAVGLTEVSTCEITVKEGQHVKKGEQVGTFHYGGSTHCLVFRPGVKLDFDLHGQTPGLHSQNIPINSRIASVPF